MKEKRFLSLILFITTFSLSAQVKGIVRDSISGKPIAYVNIWVENENIGTTSEENGTFILDIKEDKNIVFSALGYETRIIKSGKINTVSLFQKAIQLDEIVVENRKNTKEIEIGNYESSGFRWHLNAPYYAVYFKSNEELSFLKQIKFHTISEIKNAKIRIRIIESKPDLTFGNDITDEEILVEVRKGSKTNIKDLSNLRITIPKNGFFIVFEKLLIEENKHCRERSYKNSFGEKKVIKSCSYEPNLAQIPSEENSVWYSHNSDDWKQYNRIKLDKPKSYENLLMRKYHNKYLVPSLQITLTN